MKTPLRFAALFAGLAIAASACSSGASSAPSASAAAPSESAAASASAAAPSESAAAPSASALTGSVTIWEAYGASGNAEITAFKKIVANVQAANPGLTITTLDVPFNNLFNKFQTEAAAGGGPDLYIAPNDSLPGQARAGLLKDLSSLTDTLKADPYNVSDVALTADTVDGKLYAIPESMKAVALFYNKSVLATPPASTDDFLAALKGGKKLGLVYGANGGGAYYQWGFYGAFGGKILADDGKCAATATTGVADSLKFLTDVKAAGGVLYKNDNDAKADFIAGKIAGFVDGPWMTGDLKKALGDNLAVAPGPSGPGGAFQPMAAPDGYYVNDSSPNADLAVQVALQMIASANLQLSVDQAGHIPANTKMTIADPITQGFATAVATGFPRPTVAELNNYWGPFGDAIAKVVEKGLDPKAAVADACAAMDKANKK